MGVIQQVWKIKKKSVMGLFRVMEECDILYLNPQIEF